MRFWKMLHPLLVRHFNGYRQFFDWTKGRWEFVHRRVAERFFGQIPRGHEVHHVDRNKLNNSPSNLQVLPRDAHRALHRIKMPAKTPRQPRIPRQGVNSRFARAKKAKPISRDEVCPVEFPPRTTTTTSVTLDSALSRLLVRFANNRHPFSPVAATGGCPRCGGTGYLPAFSHVSGGVCFRCGGSGGGFNFSDWDDEPDWRYDDYEPDYYDDWD